MFSHNDSCYVPYYGMENICTMNSTTIIFSRIETITSSLLKRIIKFMSSHFILCLSLLLISIFFFSMDDAIAVDNNYHVNILNEISDTFRSKSSTFASKIQGYAITLFWLLAGISLAWTAIELALKHAEFGEIVGELAKYIIFTGLFSFLLTNGVTIAGYIYQTFAMLGGLAAGIPTSPGSIPTLEPSEVIDLGLEFYDKVSATREWDLDSIAMDLISMIIAVGFFVLTLIIATKVLVQLINLWCLMYAGAFFLGFGGSRWTQDIARNYFKSVLFASSQFFAMIFLVTIMKMVMQDLMADFDSGSMVTIIIFLIIPIIFFMIMESVPNIIGGITNGSFNFSSGAAGSAMLGAGVGAVLGAASVGNLAAKGFTPEPSKGVTDSANAVGGSTSEQTNLGNETSNSTNSSNQNNSNNNKTSFAQKMGTTPIGKAVSKTAGLGKSALKLGAMGIKATSATVGATFGTAAHPIKTTAHGINAGKEGIEKGISGIKKGAVYAAQKTKEFGNSAIKQPFVSGSNFATGSNKTNANSTSEPSSKTDNKSSSNTTNENSTTSQNNNSDSSIPKSDNSIKDNK